MSQHTYGLEQARTHLPHIAAEAHAGYSTVITRHGKPVAVVVPVQEWQSGQSSRLRKGGVLSLRGSGRDLWSKDAARTVADLRDEWAA
jgi:prevent-host-death family protein